MLEAVHRIVGRAYCVDIELSEDSVGIEIRVLLELLVCGIVDLTCGLGTQRSMDVEESLKLEVRPVVKRVSDGMGNGVGLV